jgi:hypothetical protein
MPTDAPLEEAALEFAHHLAAFDDLAVLAATHNACDRRFRPNESAQVGTETNRLSGRCLVTRPSFRPTSPTVSDLFMPSPTGVGPAHSAFYRFTSSSWQDQSVLSVLRSNRLSYTPSWTFSSYPTYRPHLGPSPQNLVARDDSPGSLKEPRAFARNGSSRQAERSDKPLRRCCSKIGACGDGRRPGSGYGRPA